MDALEELVGLFLCSKEGDLIAVLQHKAAVRDDNAAAALHSAYQNIALQAVGISRMATPSSPCSAVSANLISRTRPSAKVSILLAPGKRSRWEISFAAAISGLMMAEMPICFLMKSSSWL